MTSGLTKLTPYEPHTIVDTDRGWVECSCGEKFTARSTYLAVCAHARHRSDMIKQQIAANGAKFVEDGERARSAAINRTALDDIPF